jgi:hypothetical protein
LARFVPTRMHSVFLLAFAPVVFLSSSCDLSALSVTCVRF